MVNFKLRIRIGTTLNARFLRALQKKEKRRKKSIEFLQPYKYKEN